MPQWAASFSSSCGYGLVVQVDPLVSLMMVEKVPDSTYDMIGGLDKQIKEIKEVGVACVKWEWHWVTCSSVRLSSCLSSILNCLSHSALISLR